MSYPVVPHKAPRPPAALRLPNGDFLISLPPTPRFDAYLDRLPQRHWRTYRDDGASTLLRMSNDAAIGFLIRVKRAYPNLVVAVAPPSAGKEGSA